MMASRIASRSAAAWGSVAISCTPVPRVVIGIAAKGASLGVEGVMRTTRMLSAKEAIQASMASPSAGWEMRASVQKVSLPASRPMLSV